MCEILSTGFQSHSDDTPKYAKMVLHGAWIDRWKSQRWAGDFEPRNLGRRQGEFGYDAMSSTTWIPKRTITVKEDGAVLSRIMHIVTLAVRDFVDLWLH